MPQPIQLRPYSITLILALTMLGCAAMLSIGTPAAIAQSAPQTTSSSYQLRLLIIIPPQAGAHEVYAVFNNNATYALADENNGQYSLEAEAEQSGAEIVLARSGAEEGRDRITWTAYPGNKLTVEADYRLNDVGGLELDKVAQAVGWWSQLNNSAAATGANNQAGADNPILTGSTTVTNGWSAGSGQTLSTSDTAPAWAVNPGATGGTSSVTTNPITNTNQRAGQPTSVTVTTTTTTNGTLTTTATTASGTLTATHATPSAPPIQESVEFINTQTEWGILVLLTGLGVFALPRIIRRSNPTSREGHNASSSSLSTQNTPGPEQGNWDEDNNDTNSN